MSRAAGGAKAGARRGAESAREDASSNGCAFVSAAVRDMRRQAVDQNLTSTYDRAFVRAYAAEGRKLGCKISRRRRR